MTDVAAPLVWVLGGGGLLGGAVRRALPGLLPGVDLHADGPAAYPWRDVGACRARLAHEVERFFASAAGRPWAVAWCAGAGVVGIPEQSLASETEIFSSLVDAIAARRPPDAAGAFFYASSAGGLYAGSTAAVCDESTPVCPISPYGRAKLEQEEIVKRLAGSGARVSTVVGRISNLYGPGQNLAKPQGLISQLARSMLLGQPAHVYVPLDTRRDYVYADDCARIVGRVLARALHAAQGHEPVQACKILASGRHTSIASLIGILRRIARRPVRVVVAPTAAALLQPHALRFRSRSWRDLEPAPQTPLAVGVHRVWQHQHALLQRGRLRPRSRPERATAAPR